MSSDRVSKIRNLWAIAHNIGGYYLFRTEKNWTEQTEHSSDSTKDHSLGAIRLTEAIGNLKQYRTLVALLLSLPLHLLFWMVNKITSEIEMLIWKFVDA